MIKFTTICLFCVAVLASGEEHQHLNDSTTQALVDVRDNDSYHDHHDDHTDHDHHDHSHDHHHEHTNHKILHDEFSPAQDYATWMAATGKYHEFLDAIVPQVKFGV